MRISVLGRRASVRNPVKSVLRLALASDCLARAWKRRKFGMAMAARMPMIATTIINSIKVKPREFFRSMRVLPNKTGRDDEASQPVEHVQRWVGSVAVHVVVDEERLAGGDVLRGARGGAHG